MKTTLNTRLCLMVAAVLAVGVPTSGQPSRPSDKDGARAAFDAAVDAQPKLLRISGRFDGSGRFIFRNKSVRYEHKHWQRPRAVLFDGEPWTKLQRTPAAWRDYGVDLDLSKARIVKREGRDMIALEQTADGFDLYIGDSPNGAADYTVTLAVPRRN